MQGGWTKSHAFVDADMYQQQLLHSSPGYGGIKMGEMVGSTSQIVLRKQTGSLAQPGLNPTQFFSHVMRPNSIH